MKQRRSLITLVAVFFVALACAFGVLNFKSKASAAEYITAPTTFTVAEEGFELAEKASIRLTDGKAAIKFTAIVTEDFHNAHEGANYIATMNIVGSSDVKALAFDAPQFNEGVAELNAYLNFDGASQQILELALATEFEAAVYAEVDGTYYQAKGSNTVDRSMRVVANDAYLNWTEGVGYEKADVADLGYFTNGLRSDKEFAVVGADDTLYVNIPGAPASAAEIYVDDVKVAATYDAATAKYTVADFATAGKYITVFDATGKAYSTNVAEGKYTIIGDLQALKDAFGTAGDITGKYALVSDIAVGAWTAVATNMYGTLNGLGYVLSGFSISGAISGYNYSGLFGYSMGATIKNLSVETAYGAGTGRYGGILFAWISKDVAANPDAGTEAVTYADTVIDNVYIFNKYNGTFGACIAAVQQHHTIVKDSIFVTGFIGDTNTVNGNGGTVVYNNSATLDATNTIAITNVYGRVALDSRFITGVTEYKTLGALYNLDQKEDVVGDYQWSKLTEINAFLPLDKDNITDLMTKKDGYFVITEDIDMGPITKITNDGLWEFPWGTNGKDFKGVLDGADHTLSNLYLNGYTGSGTFYGFISPNNAVVTNLNMNVIETGYRGGVFGRTNGLYINECAIKFDNSNTQYSAGLLSVMDPNLVRVKDSFLYVGTGYTGGGTYGWLASHEGFAGKLTADNFHVVNPNTLRTYAMYQNDSNKRTNAEVITGDFAYYTDPAVYLADTEKTALPANVVAGIDKIGAIVALNQDNLARAKTATGGYWYLTDDIDISTNGTIFDFAPGNKTITSGAATRYFGAAVHFDGRGHTVSGITRPAANSAPIINSAAGNVVIKNVALKGQLMTGGGSNGNNLFVGITRENWNNNQITIQNVFADIAGMDMRNGALFTSWTAFNAGNPMILDKVFVNVTVVGWNFVMTGHVWAGTIKCNDVFIMMPGCTDGTIAINAPNGTVEYQDFDGNVITPGGDGDYDFACSLFESLADLKEINGGDDWAYAQETFGDLAPEFFEIEA